MKSLTTLKQLGLISLIILLASCASNSNRTDSTTDDASAYADVTPVDVSSADSSDTNTARQALEIPTVATTFYFAYDRSILTSAAKQALSTHADYLKSSATRAIIEGHADERGSREYNIALGEQRAKSVQRFLISQGVRTNKLETVSYGEEKPVSRANNELAWSANRRAILKYR